MRQASRERLRSWTHSDRTEPNTSCLSDTSESVTELEDLDGTAVFGRCFNVSLPVPVVNAVLVLLLSAAADWRREVKVLLPELLYVSRAV